MKGILLWLYWHRNAEHYSKTRRSVYLFPWDSGCFEDFCFKLSLLVFLFVSMSFPFFAGGSLLSSSWDLFCELEVDSSPNQNSRTILTFILWNIRQIENWKLKVPWWSFKVVKSSHLKRPHRTLSRRRPMAPWDVWLIQSGTNNTRRYCKHVFFMNSLIDKCKEKNLLFTQQITNVITKQCFAGDQGRQFPLLKLIYTRCLLDWLNMRKILNHTAVG